VTLWLARHAQVLAEPGLCYGVLELGSDPSATLAAATALAGELPVGIRLRCSPRVRCRELVVALRNLRVDLPAEVVDPRLAEMDFGRWEGQRWSEIGKEAVDAWTADFWTHRFGGQQSVAEFMAVVSAAWQEHLQRAQDEVWITHAGVIRACDLLNRGIHGPLQSHEWVGTEVPMGKWLQLVG
jgi:alpha-ribazole phosphatase